jgi:CarD family transcriptional regulator
MLKLLQNKEIFEVIYMFKIGDYVVNLKNGVCKIEDILNMNLSGESKEYYLLIPQNEQNAKVYIPVDAADSRIRLTMDKEQAMALIKKMKEIEEISIENKKSEREFIKRF